jgi:hypothetical protein
MTAIKPKFARFKSHCDDVPSQFEPGDILRILEREHVDGEPTGGLIAQRVGDGVQDLVWPEELHPPKGEQA